MIVLLRSKESVDIGGARGILGAATVQVFHSCVGLNSKFKKSIPLANNYNHNLEDIPPHKGERGWRALFVGKQSLHFAMLYRGSRYLGSL